MMSPDQFLLDLADNLDIRADMIELKIAVNSGHDVKRRLLQLVRRVKPYRDRIGYNHTFQGPLYKGLSDQSRRLAVPELTAALSFQGSPVTTKGYVVNLLDVVVTREAPETLQAQAADGHAPSSRAASRSKCGVVLTATPRG